MEWIFIIIPMEMKMVWGRCEEMLKKWRLAEAQCAKKNSLAAAREFI
jgi:hypothetical protein